MVALFPEPEQRRAHAKRPFHLASDDQVVDGGAEVIVLRVARAQPGLPIGRHRLERHFFGEHEQVGGMRPLRAGSVTALPERLPRILPERFEHHEARHGIVGYSLHEEAVVDERGDAVEDVNAEVLARVADRLGRVQRATAGEHGETPKQPLLGW